MTDEIEKLVAKRREELMEEMEQNLSAQRNLAEQRYAHHPADRRAKLVDEFVEGCRNGFGGGDRGFQGTVDRMVDEYRRSLQQN